MKSISKRLTLRIMMVVLAMMSVIAGVVYVAVGEYMDDEAEKRFQIVVTRAHREVQRRLSEVYVANVNNVHEIERDIDDPDKLYDHLERIVRRNPYIVSCGLLFIPDYYPEKGRFFVPFATRDTAECRLGGSLHRESAADAPNSAATAGNTRHTRPQP